MNRNIYFVILIVALVSVIWFYNDNKKEADNVVSPQKTTSNSEESTNKLISKKPILYENENQAKSDNGRLVEQNTSTQKKIFEKDIQDKTDANIASTKRDISASEEKRNLAEDITDLYQKAKDGDWEGFLEQSENLEHLDSEYLNAALLNAVTYNAPLDTIKYLVSMGAIFLPESILALSLRNNVTLTKQLVPLGLDLHGKDTFHKNGITYTLMMSSPKKEMFDYLIIHNVSVKPGSEGNDPLDLALRNLMTDNATIYYVEKLIDFGAPIEASHREIVNEIRLKNIDIYNELKSNVQELF